MKAPGSPQDSLLRFLMPNIQVVFWAALFFGILNMGPRLMNMDGDIGRHLTIGQWILSTRSIPTSDVFSHTMAGEPLTPHEWLAQVFFALANQFLGLDGVVILTAAVIATAFWLVFHASIQRSGSLLAGLVISFLAAGAASLHWLTRPHIFTFLFLALWVHVLEQIRAGKTRAWLWLPLLMLAWVNTHGAYIAGMVVWLIYVLGWAWERWIERSEPQSTNGGLKPLLLGGVVSAAITFANPAGAYIWATSVGYVGNEYLVGHTAEYLSPDFHDSSTWLFLLLIVFALGVLGLAGRRRDATDVLLVCAWLAMSLYSARNIPLFAIVAAPVIAKATWEVLHAMAERVRAARQMVALDERICVMETRLRGWVWIGVAMIVAAMALQSGVRLDALRQGNQFDATVFPVEAVNWLEDHPQEGEVFNYFPWGGYLLYRQWPEVNVFIDGQTDFYGEALTREYEQVLLVDAGWENILAKYKVGWVIWPVDGRLAQTLQASTDWKLVYKDDTAVVFSLR